MQTPVVSHDSFSLIVITEACVKQWELFKENRGVAEVLNLPSILEVAEYISSTRVFYKKRETQEKLWLSY